jgi:hypothetical protein
MTTLAWVGTLLVVAAVALVGLAGWTLLGDAPPRQPPRTTARAASPARAEPAAPAPAPTRAPPRAAVLRDPAGRAPEDPRQAWQRADRADRWALARAAGLDATVAWRDVAPTAPDADVGADALHVAALEALEDALPSVIARRAAWIVACGGASTALVALLPALARLATP